MPRRGSLSDGRPRRARWTARRFHAPPRRAAIPSRASAHTEWGPILQAFWDARITICFDRLKVRSTTWCLRSTAEERRRFRSTGLGVGRRMRSHSYRCTNPSLGWLTARLAQRSAGLRAKMPRSPWFCATAADRGASSCAGPEDASTRLTIVHHRNPVLNRVSGHALLRAANSPPCSRVLRNLSAVLRNAPESFGRAPETPTLCPDF